MLDGALAIVELHARAATTAPDAAAYPRMSLMASLAALLGTDAIAPHLIARARATFESLANALLPSELAPLVDALVSSSPVAAAAALVRRFFVALVRCSRLISSFTQCALESVLKVFASICRRSLALV